MDIGKLRYHIATRKKVKEGQIGGIVSIKSLMLTLVDMSDEDILSAQGLSELRKKRIVRLTEEAQKQGMLLSYEDLNALLLSSVSTLKRDVNSLERQGCFVHLKGRRVNSCKR
ncbi:MAG: DUF1670 domain-containing protein [Thermodesulfovibrionales bacterium]